ncbi:hypothetical protein LIA77_00813 [Sarocladium implicatum]|nr:hypothetical protein LIA77_00813 [Sarocladium implicatum]
MFTKSLFTFAASALLASASPTNITARQEPIPSIPDGYIYVAEWFPNGCGHGDKSFLYGAENSLASCSNFQDPLTAGEADTNSVRFTFPENDDRNFQWKLFGSQDCSEQIAQGSGGGCFSVPIGQAVGAVIVYT